MKIRGLYQTRGKFAVVNRSKDGQPASLLVGVALENLAEGSEHGDVIAVEMTIRVVRRWRSEGPLGDAANMALGLGDDLDALADEGLGWTKTEGVAGTKS